MKNATGVSTLTSAAKPTKGTVVAGSWGSSLDMSKTLFDPDAAAAARAALDKTLAMVSAPRVLQRAKSQTMLLRPAPSAAPPAETNAAGDGTRLLELDIVENVSGTPRYRDMLSRRDEHAFLLMTDFAANTPMSATLLSHLQTSVRGAVVAGEGPGAVLALMNHELALANAFASATCARVNVDTRSVVMASAGGQAPFILHSHGRVSRMRAIPGGMLGRPSNTRFREQTLPFGRGDALLVPSLEWVSSLERIFASPVAMARRMLSFARRERRARPVGGSLLFLHVR